MLENEIGPVITEVVEKNPNKCEWKLYFNRMELHRITTKNNIFRGRWIDRLDPTEWTVRSPDLSRMDFISVGLFKTKVV